MFGNKGKNSLHRYRRLYWSAAALAVASLRRSWDFSAWVGRLLWHFQERACAASIAPTVVLLSLRLHGKVPRPCDHEVRYLRTLRYCGDTTGIRSVSLSVAWKKVHGVETMFLVVAKPFITITLWFTEKYLYCYQLPSSVWCGRGGLEARLCDRQFETRGLRTTPVFPWAEAYAAPVWSVCFFSRTFHYRARHACGCELATKDLWRVARHPF